MLRWGAVTQGVQVSRYPSLVDLVVETGVQAGGLVGLCSAVGFSVSENG